MKHALPFPPVPHGLRPNVMGGYDEDPQLPKYPSMMLSGLEPCNVTKEAVGERCNLMGSAKFKKLVDAYKWDEAMEVCIAPCEKKADISDFNFDSDLIDRQSAMLLQVAGGRGGPEVCSGQS